MTIDVVYTWVDMTDPVWLAKYLAIVPAEEMPHYNRFGNFGELCFSVRTVRKFAPFVRNIFIVTDNQIPREFSKDDWEKYGITIVSHDDIFGPECCRPTFKSNSIEAYLHKIDGLSEIFWYFNDDTFLANHISKKMLDYRNVIDFFPKKISVSKKTPKIEGWRWGIYNARKLIEHKFGKSGKSTNLSFTHQATLMRKKACRLTWKLFKPELSKSVSYPLRKPYQDTVHFVLLSQLVAIEKGYFKARTRIPFKMMSLNVNTEENAKKNFDLIRQRKPHFACVNNLTPETAKYFEKFSQKYLLEFK